MFTNNNQVIGSNYTEEYSWHKKSARNSERARLNIEQYAGDLYSNHYALGGPFEKKIPHKFGTCPKLDGICQGYPYSFSQFVRLFELLNSFFANSISTLGIIHGKRPCFQKVRKVKFDSHAQTVLDEATEPWGIKVERVEM